MWSSGDNIVYGPNRMWTSPNSVLNVGRTIDDFFDLEDDNTITAVDDMPVKASNFKITSSDEDILADNSNAVNISIMKSYLDGHIPDVTGFITEDEANARFETIAEHEAFVEELSQRLAADENNISLKANSTDVYSKELVDSKLDLKADVTVVNDISSQLQTKANTTDVYNKTETDAKIDVKANSADVYDKTEVDSKIETIDTAIVTVAAAVDTKANISDVYMKSETYDRTTIDQKIADAGGDPEVEYVTVYSPDAKWKMGWDVAGFTLGLVDTTLHAVDIATGRVAGPFAVVSSLKTIGSVCAATLKILTDEADSDKDPEEEDGKVISDVVTNDEYYKKKNDTKSDLDKAVVAFKTLINNYYNKDDVYTKDEADDKFAPKQDTRGPILSTFNYTPVDYTSVAKTHYTEEQIIVIDNFAIEPFISELHYNSDPNLNDGKPMWQDYYSEEPKPQFGWMPLCSVDKSDLYDNSSFVSEYNFKIYFDFGTNSHAVGQRYSKGGIDSFGFSHVTGFNTIIEYDNIRAWFEESKFYIVDLNNSTSGFEHVTDGSNSYDVYCQLKPTVIQTGSGDTTSDWERVFSDQNATLIYFTGDCRKINTATNKQFVIWIQGSDIIKSALFHSLLEDIQNGVEFGGETIYPYNIKRDIREYYDINEPENIQSVHNQALIEALQSRVSALETASETITSLSNRIEFLETKVHELELREANV